MAERHNMILAASPGDFKARVMPLNGLELPATGQVHLWFLDLAQLAGSLRNALGGGHSTGAAGADALTPVHLQFVRRFYLRLLLGAYLGLPGKSVRINRQNRGKPVLDATVHDESVHFSMAKSNSCLFVGFSTTCDIGVDLEPANRRARDALGVARRYFTTAEANALSAMSSTDLDRAFLRAWACKEAVVKASGEGIANQFCRFAVETDLSRPAAVLKFEDDDRRHWSLALVQPNADFLGAVAIPDQGMVISAFQLLPATRPTGSQ